MRGANVTMPFKTTVVPYLDRLTPAAETIQAVNTIVNEDGVLVGYNTDGCGYTQNLRRNGIEVAGKKITLIGCGGVGSSIAVQVALEGAAELAIFNRKDKFWPSIEERMEAIRKVARHQLDRAPGVAQNPRDVDILDLGVPDTGSPAGAWALANRGAPPSFGWIELADGGWTWRLERL